MSKNFLKTLNLSRTEDTREKIPTQLPDADLNKIKGNFDLNIARISDKFSIVNQLQENNLNQAAEDILRSQIVLLMSALDFYMHEIVKYGMLKMFRGEKAKTPSYKNFVVTLTCLEDALKNPESIDWLEEFIIIKNRKETFMGEDKVKQALSLISTKKIYTAVINNLTITPESFKTNFSDLYKRRNQIAHQSDRNESTGNIEDIQVDYVGNYISIITEFINKIHTEIQNDV
ncbi:MAG: HEPN domain-containing protein [Clostridium sp.]